MVTKVANSIRRRYWDVFLIGLLVIVDMLSAMAATDIISGRLIGLLPATWFLFTLITLFLVNALSGLYSPEGTVSRVDEALQFMRNTFLLAMGGIAVTTIFEIQLGIGPRGIMKIAIFYGIITLTARLIIRSVQKRLFYLKIGSRRTIIVGENERAQEISRQILTQPHLGYELLGYVCEGKPAAPPPTSGHYLGATKDLPELIRQYHADDIILTAKYPDHEDLLQLMSRINGSPVEIKILPDMYEVVTGLARTEHITGLPLIRINPEFISPLQKLLKRTIDVAVASVGLVLTAPILLITGILVRLTSHGPAFFNQVRIGLRGRQFMMHKIRTMVADAEASTGPVWAQCDDPRVTKLGRFLRNTRIDELPQLWNVLRGDMSLVGPRPERPHFVELLTREFPYYHRRLMVRPGITGWAQVRGTYDQSLDDVRQKLKDDFFYIENLSVRLDLKVLLMTIRVVFTARGH